MTTLPPTPRWVSTALTAKFDVQVNGVAVPWLPESPEYRPWSGEGIEIVRRAVTPQAIVTLFLRGLPDDEAMAWWCNATANTEAEGISGTPLANVRVVIQDALCHLWNRGRRFSEVKESRGGRLTVALMEGDDLQDLLAGQSLSCGGVVWLTPEGEAREDGSVVSHATDWHEWQEWTNPHVLLGTSKFDSYVSFLTSEQNRLRFPDPLHRAIFGCLEQPGATGAQNDFCWIPKIAYESEIVQSVWQEGCRPTHFYDERGRLLRSVPDKTVYWNGRPVGHDDTGAKGWRGHDRQHYSLNYLCGLAAVCDDPLVWLEVRHQVELWIANHPVSSGTPKDSLDSPRAVGRAMAAGVKLWLLTRDERLKAQILRRADRVHAVLSEHMAQRMGVMEYAHLGSVPGKSLNFLDERGSFSTDGGGDIEVQLGERGGGHITSATTIGPILEVRAPDPRALPVNHWRPWEEATAAIGMAMVARVFGRPQDYWSSAVLALNVMQTGYRDDGQIAFAMAWPTPPKEEQRPGLTVQWADGTEFRLWCRAALQWVELLTKPVVLKGELPEVGTGEVATLGSWVFATKEESTPLAQAIEAAGGYSPVHDQAQALLALTPAPSDPVQLAAWERWCVNWEAVGE